MDPSEIKAMKNDLLREAKFAQEHRMFEQMYIFMIQIIDLTDAETDLSPIERSLLVVAFRNYLLSHWKIRRLAISLTQSHHNKPGWVSACLYRFEQAISQRCTDILNLIDRRLLPSAESIESQVFYLTLKGDFSWHLAELKGPIDGKGDADMARNAYLEAQLKLGDQNSHCLALNLSLAEYSYWHLNAPEEASKYVDLAMSEALSTPKHGATTSLLSFGLIEDLEHLKKKIEKSKNKKIKNEAGPSNVSPATSLEAPHF